MADSDNREEFWKNIKSEYYQTNTAYGSEQREFLSRLMVKNGIKSILELGCNSGGNLLHISKVLPSAKLVGLDICENAIKYGKEIEKNPAELIVGSIYDLGEFQDKSFDVVFTRGVMMHINHEKIRGILKNMTRIASKHVINIERHGPDKIMSFGADKTPHAFRHNFIADYDSFGIKAQVKNMFDLTHKIPKGGAEHFIWFDFKDKLIF